MPTRTGDRDRWRGWSFWLDRAGNHHVRTPDGFERTYSQAVAAETLLGLLEQRATDPDFNEQYLDYWRKVVGELRYRQALRVLETLAAEVSPA